MSTHDLLTSLADAPDPLIGQTLAERYKIVRKLGEGGMGVVYEGEHILIKRRVAIKTLHAQYARNAEVVLRFQREALAATAIGNEHIIEATDMGRLPDASVFLVLEYLDGRDFGKLLEDTGALPVGRAAHIVVQICDALQAAHDKGIVHRDLKPENIYLIRRGNDPTFVKVLDFGISKFLDASQSGGGMTRTGAAVGTPYYMSPEQSRGDKSVDHRSDIYSIGVILFQALTGRLPFMADNFPGLMIQIVTEPAPDVRTLRADIPEDLSALIARTLSKSPNDRPQSCRELRALLERYAIAPSASQPGTDTAMAATGYVDPSSAAPPRGAAYAPPNATTGGLSVPGSSSSMQAAVPQRALAMSGGSLAGTSRLEQDVATRGKFPTVPVVGGALALGLVATLLVVRPWSSGATARASTQPDTPLAVPDAARTNIPDPPVNNGSATAANSTASGQVGSTAAPAANVRVNIASTPPGARLTLDGSPIMNPFHADMPSSRDVHRIEASLDGYRTVVQEVALLFPQDVNILLTRGAGVEHRSLSHSPTAATAGSHGSTPGPGGSTTPGTTGGTTATTTPVPAIPTPPATPNAGTTAATADHGGSHGSGATTGAREPSSGGSTAPQTTQTHGSGATAPSHETPPANTTGPAGGPQVRDPI